MDVDTAGEDVGGDEDFSRAVAEGVDDDVALEAFELAGETCYLVAFSVHTSFNLESSLAGLVIVKSHVVQPSKEKSP